MEVIYSNYFASILLKMNDDDLSKINVFVNHVSLYGLTNLIGRNKCSWESSIPEEEQTVTLKAELTRAKQLNLWHYHIGIPNYVIRVGKYTSEYYLHYQKFDNYIRIVGISSHPPFTHASNEMLK